MPRHQGMHKQSMGLWDLEFSVAINNDKYVDYALKCEIDKIMSNKKL